MHGFSLRFINLYFRNFVFEARTTIKIHIIKHGPTTQVGRLGRMLISCKKYFLGLIFRAAGRGSLYSIFAFSVTLKCFIYMRQICSFN